MAMKSIVLVSLLVVVFAASQAEAQLLPAIFQININGTIFCTLNGSIVPNAATLTPPFPNAVVLVSCGGNVIARAITNGAGEFNITLNALQVLPSALLSSCKVVVATPLASCNANLPSGGLLQAPLQLLTTIRGLLSILTFIPGVFQLA